MEGVTKQFDVVCLLPLIKNQEFKDHHEGAFRSPTFR